MPVACLQFCYSSLKKLSYHALNGFGDFTARQHLPPIQPNITIELLLSNPDCLRILGEKECQFRKGENILQCPKEIGSRLLALGLVKPCHRKLADYRIIAQPLSLLDSQPAA